MGIVQYVTSRIGRRWYAWAALVALVFAASFWLLVGDSDEITLVPVADAHVLEVVPEQNFGSNVNLRTDTSPQMLSYVRFDVRGHIPANSVTIRVFAETANSLGIELRSVADTTWSESEITFDSAPELGPAIAFSGPFAPGTWLEYDVSDVVTADGLYSFVLTSTSSTATRLSSREGTDPPKLTLGTS